MNLTKTMKYNGLVPGIILICLIMSLLPVNTVAADTTLPEVFYGDITVNGVPALEETVIVAMIGGVERGSFTTTEDGTYGGPGTFDTHLMVSGEKSDIGKPITFWINGSQADQTEIYEPGESMELNLTAWVYPLQSADTQIDDALYYLRWMQSQQSNGSIGGFDVDAWAVMAIAAAGQDPNTWTAGGASIVDYLRNNASHLDPNKATDWERSILAIVAAGDNPRNFSGINYIDTLLAFYNGGQIGDSTLLNDDFWGILALKAIGEGQAIIEASKTFITKNQNDDWGWGNDVGSDSDADNTAAAVSALIAAGVSPGSQTITNALSYLKSQQQSNGGFFSETATNSAVDSWVINAIADAGQSPVGDEWRRSGKTPIEHLLSLQDEGGFFNYKAGVESQPVWMTAYALIALMGNSWPKDTSPPVITNLTPASGASTTSTSPAISASYSDAVSGINTATATLRLDGTNVTSSATATASGISYAASGLTVGTHSVVVTVSDKAGNEANKSWSFQVISSGGGSSGGGGGGGGGGSTPGYTNVTEYVTSTGRFTKEVIAKSEDGKVELDISKDTVGKNRVGQPLRNITITEMKNPPAPPVQSNFIELVYDLSPDGATFEPPISLTLSYDPDEIPTGVAEDNLVIAVWNEVDDIWEELLSIVDPANNTITAQVSHFTAFTILAYTRPANFTLSNLSITPAEVNVGEKIKISVRITNSGDLEGTYEVSFEIDDAVVRTKEVTLAGGDSDSVSLSITQDVAGEYKVNVGDLAGTFKVKPQLAQAKFYIKSLSISPSEVQSGQSVTISAFVGNTGELAGTYKVTLKIDDIAAEVKEITLASGASKAVIFTVIKESAGSYAVDINGLSGTFIVREKASTLAKTPAPSEPSETAKSPPPSAKPFNWLALIIVIAAAIVAGLVIFFAFRRSTY